MSKNTNNILLRYGYLPMWHEGGEPSFDMSRVATVAMNLSYFGFSMDSAGMRTVMRLSESDLPQWWKAIESELKSITGDDRPIADFVVYKNFPQECLEMDQAEYWFNQICIYWGFPQDFLTQEVEPREGMDEAPPCKVLRLQNFGTLQSILNNLVAQPARWKNEERNDALFLAETLPVDFGAFGFKENLVTLAAAFIDVGKRAKVNTATDVLRLAAGLSDGDVSLREKVRFKKFKRSERRFLLEALESCRGLMEDVARRQEPFKRLFKALHPFDYIGLAPTVCEVADALYKGNLYTFNSLVENALEAKDEEALSLLKTRPGEFRRRLAHCMDLFGHKAVDAFTSDEVLSKLTVAQLVGTRRYMETATDRVTRIIAPKGNWGRLKIQPARRPDKELAAALAKALGTEIGSRVPKIKTLDPLTEYIKLPSNDGEVSPFARGTTFPIPNDVEFIRTASYWRANRTIWFDNGINFFDTSWQSKGTLCWISNIGGRAAVFSGDPVSGYTKVATQLIDMYPAKLREKGIRYCVWNILCFSHVKFSEAREIHASLQWGANAQKGKLFEPSRAQLSFPLTGDTLTKYICYIDLERMEMVYMDVGMPGAVSSASVNENRLSEMMPAYVEYLNSLPSVADLFRESVDEAEGNGHVLYTDKDVEIRGTKNEPETAYVFRPANESNSYNELDINPLLV